MLVREVLMSRVGYYARFPGRTVYNKRGLGCEAQYPICKVDSQVISRMLYIFNMIAIHLILNRFKQIN